MKREEKKKIETYRIQNKRVRVFFMFLLLSFFIWLLMELAKTATSNVFFTTKYTNLPALKIIQNKPIPNIEVTLRASGFKLLEYKLKNKTIKLSLSDIIEKGKKSYLLPNKQLAKLNLELSSDIQILKIQPDTIFVEIGTKLVKKVPVTLNAKVNYKQGYHLVDKLTITPDSITISGGEKYVSKIKEVTTNLLELKKVYENINQTVLLQQKGDYKNVNYSKNKIEVNGKVDKTTEGNFMIPVEIINVPNNIKINPFPKNIKIIYQSGLTNFEQITTKSVTVIFDYNQYKKDTTIQFLTPIIKHKSKLISSLKIEPSQVEFLIQK